MSIGEIGRRITYFFRRERIDREIEEEIRFHRELRAREVEDRSFGNEAILKEAARAQWHWRPVEEFRHDLRYAVRMLRRSPGFTVVAVVSLALGIGANTAIFSLLDTLMLKTMPVQSPEQLRVLVWSASGGPGRSYDGYAHQDSRLGEIRGSFPPPVFRLFREHVGQFSDFVGFSNIELSVTVNGETGVARGQYVSGNFFVGLGVSTLAGRPILEEDDAPGKAQVAVISYQYWNQRFGLDPSAIGKHITIDQKPVTIVGVLPAGFLGVTLSRQCDVYLPLTFAAEVDPDFYALTRTDRWWVESIGRLRPGVSNEEGASALTAALINWTREQGGTAYTKGPRVHLLNGARGEQGFRRDVEPKLFVLAGFVCLVLLIACVNLASLLLARSTARRREIAVRLSIGAGKFRLIRQLITESVLLAGAGGLLGLAVAAPLSPVVLQMISGSATPGLDMKLDSRTLVFTFALSALTGIVFGALPALRSTYVDLTPALKNTGTPTSGLPVLRLGRALIVAQVGLSLILLVGAGLFVRTLVALLNTDLGFVSKRLITFRADASRIGYKGERLVDVYGRVRDAISAMPGVQSVAMSNHGLITNSRRTNGVHVPGYVAREGEDRGSYILICSHTFLSTMQIPVIAGRDLSPADTASSSRVIVVNKAFVKKFFPSLPHPVGQMVHIGDATTPLVEIVGVSADARYSSVRGDYPPTAYQPYTQVIPGRMTFAVRTSLPMASVGPAIRRAVSGIDSLIPVTEVRTQAEVNQRHLATERLFAILVSAFGIVAVLLAAIGLYGVMAYTMSRRTAEIGIRMALGANGRNVQWLIVRDAVLMVVLGLVIGVPAALALTDLVRKQLYGVQPNDTISFVGAVATMILIAGLAAWLPARRAARVDPMIALKYE